ncbi:hypothetical protein LTS16_008039 [Friedmanniomyces endolithicus]|nr:hypothetical protein LTS16_008039 [Friedmanniomyces endolithicus]
MARESGLTRTVLGSECWDRGAGVLLGKLVAIAAPNWERKVGTELGVDRLGLYSEEGGDFLRGSLKRLRGEMLREIVEGFERGELVVPAEKGVSLIGVEGAIDAYAGE